MPALAINMEKDMYTNKIYKQTNNQSLINL